MFPGKKIKEPVSLLKENFESYNLEKGQNIVQNMIEARERLARNSDVNKVDIDEIAHVRETYSNKMVKVREFNVGDKVLTLVPSNHEKLSCAWSGPYIILKKVKDTNYIVETNSRTRARKKLHVNMLKPYIEHLPNLLCKITTQISKK